MPIVYAVFIIVFYVRWHQKYFKFNFNFNLIFDLIEARSTLDDLEWRTQPYEVLSSGCPPVLLPAVNVLASRCELQLRDLCAKLPTRDYKCHAVQDCAPSPLLPLLPLLAATAALFIYFQRQRWQRCLRRRRRRRSCSCSRSRSHTANPKAAPVACLLSVLLLMGGHRLTITRFNRHRR